MTAQTPSLAELNNELRIDAEAVLINSARDIVALLGKYNDITLNLRSFDGNRAWTIAHAAAVIWGENDPNAIRWTKLGEERNATINSLVAQRDEVVNDMERERDRIVAASEILSCLNPYQGIPVHRCDDMRSSWPTTMNEEDIRDIIGILNLHE